MRELVKVTTQLDVMDVNSEGIQYYRYPSTLLMRESLEASVAILSNMSFMSELRMLMALEETPVSGWT